MLVSPEAWPMPIEPHAAFRLEGLLCEVSRDATSTEVVNDTRIRLMDIVRLLIDWGDARKVEAHVGDHRFLVLDFMGADGITRFAQIWAEPALEPIVEVGPGVREDTALQAVADAMAPALTERGFRIAGSANNFRTRFRVPSPEDAEALSTLLLDLLTAVCGYDGTTDLNCKLMQESHAGNTYVMHNVTREQLVNILDKWGFKARFDPNDAEALLAMHDNYGFKIGLMSHVKDAPERYTELHCYISMDFRKEHISRVLHAVNNRPNFVSAWPLSVKGRDANLIRFSTGIELYGGVAPDHVRFRLHHWIAEMKAVCEAFEDAMVAMEDGQSLGEIFQVH
jgi:hypothetical protein